MVETLTNGDDLNRLDVLEKLGESGSLAQRAAPAIVKCLGDQSATIRAGAALALARIGFDGPAMTRALSSMLADADAIVRLNTVIALSAGARDTPEAIESLDSAQQDSDPRVGAAAAAALERIRKGD
jgi:HEAT repeat protein